MFRLLLKAADVQETSATLDTETSHYLQRVLRVRPGDTGSLIIEGDCILTIKLTEINKHNLGFTRLSETPVQNPTYPHITLGQCLPKQDKMSGILKACTECGVSAFLPLTSERCIPTLNDKKEATRTARWKTTLHSAAIQSQQMRIPALYPIQSIQDLSTHFETQTYDLKLVPWEEENIENSLKTVLASCSNTPQRVFVLIGPEGGLSADEVTGLTSLGFQAVSLGETILRVEHAGIVAGSFINLWFS